MLQGKEHHFKSQEVPIVAVFFHCGSRFLLRCVQVGSFMDIPALEDILMDLLGLGVPSQREGEEGHLTSTVSSEQRRRTISPHLVSFPDSSWTQLNATGSAKTQDAPMAPQGQSSSSTSSVCPLPWALGQGQDEVP